MDPSLRNQTDPRNELVAGHALVLLARKVGTTIVGGHKRVYSAHTRPEPVWWSDLAHTTGTDKLGTITRRRSPGLHAGGDIIPRPGGGSIVTAPTEVRQTVLCVKLRGPSSRRLRELLQY